MTSLLIFSGYGTFFPEASDYDLNGAPRSWAKIPALRHALTLWPHSTYFWYLDQSALIMNPDLTVDSIMTPKRMEKLMIKDQPIVPPDSVIKTFTHLHGDQIVLASRLAVLYCGKGTGQYSSWTHGSIHYIGAITFRKPIHMLLYGCPIIQIKHPAN